MTFIELGTSRLAGGDPLVFGTGIVSDEEKPGHVIENNGGIENGEDHSLAPSKCKHIDSSDMCDTFSCCFNCCAQDPDDPSPMAA